MASTNTPSVLTNLPTNTMNHISLRKKFRSIQDTALSSGENLAKLHESIQNFRKNFGIINQFPTPSIVAGSENTATSTTSTINHTASASILLPPTNTSISNTMSTANSIPKLSFSSPLRMASTPLKNKLIIGEVENHKTTHDFEETIQFRPQKSSNMSDFANFEPTVVFPASATKALTMRRAPSIPPSSSRKTRPIRPEDLAPFSMDQDNGFSSEIEVTRHVEQAFPEDIEKEPHEILMKQHQGVDDLLQEELKREMQQQRKSDDFVLPNPEPISQMDENVSTSSNEGNIVQSNVVASEKPKSSVIFNSKPMSGFPIPLSGTTPFQSILDEMPDTIVDTNFVKAPRIHENVIQRRDEDSKGENSENEDEALISRLTGKNSRASRSSFENNPLLSPFDSRKRKVELISKIETPIKEKPIMIEKPVPSSVTKEREKKRRKREEKKHASPSSHDEKMFSVKGVEYTLIDEVGKGGSSKVYKVFSDKKIYALKKVVLEGHDQSTLDGFMNEADLLQKLRGKPNIIQLYSSEIKDNCLYLVMEYGEADLASLLRKSAENSNFFNPNLIRLYWQQMLEAVQTIHEERIVHSDLKPANFLLVQGTLKLIDFGIAKAIQSDTTNIVRDNPVGTINYISPETLNENTTGSGPKIKVGRASDIWSLGCILYQMVYGKTPFAHIQNMMSKFRAIVDESVQIKFPDCGDAYVVDVLKRALVRDPKKRITIPELLDHPFMKPYLARAPLLEANQILATKERIETDIKDVLRKYKLDNQSANVITAEIISRLQKK